MMDLQNITLEQAERACEAMWRRCERARGTDGWIPLQHRLWEIEDYLAEVCGDTEVQLQTGRHHEMEW